MKQSNKNVIVLKVGDYFSIHSVHILNVVSHIGIKEADEFSDP